MTQDDEMEEDSELEEEFDDEEGSDDEEVDYDDEEEDPEDNDDGAPIRAQLKSIAACHIPLFEKTEEQLESFFEEFSILSKKKPDGPLNTFKVDLLNHTIGNANGFLEGDYLPFPSFSQFGSTSLPTASDVVTILAQYLRSMNSFRRDYTTTQGYGGRKWLTADGSRHTSKPPKKFGRP
jgi:hypothetical protein